MTENKPNPDEKKSVRLSLRFWSYVKDEQVRIRKEVGGREPPQEDVADQILDDAISYRGLDSANSSANSPTIKSTDSPLTSGENTDYNCATPQEIELQHALSRIMRSGNQRVIASVVNLLAVSEEFAQLGVALGRTDAEPSPAESRVEGDPELPEKLGGNVQIIGGSAAGIRGKGARGQH